MIASAIAMTNALPTGRAVLDPEKVLAEAGIRQDMQVAELGIGGVGHFLLPAAQMVGPGGHVYGVDILKSVLEANQSRMRLAGVVNVEFIWGDVERPRGTQLPDSSMDLVTLINILYAVKREAALAEAFRILHTGGTLLIVDWKPAGTRLGPTAGKRLTPAEATAVATKAGFVLDRTFEAGPHHYGVILTKP